MCRGYFFVFSALLLVSCARPGPSPFEIKVDQDYEVDSNSKTNTQRSEKTAIISSVENIYTPEEKAAIAANKKKEEEDKKASAAAVATSTKTDPKTGRTFNEQAEILSNPKITKPATQAAAAKTQTNQTKKSAPQEILKLSYPAKGEVISRFGDDMGDGIINDGINIKAPEGNNVRAAGDGTVIYAGNKLEEDFGNVVIIQHDSNYGNLITSYAHLKNIKVKNNAKVKTGDVIGSVGKTGDVKTPQVHFEVMKGNKPLNPMKYLQK